MESLSDFEKNVAGFVAWGEGADPQVDGFGTFDDDFPGYRLAAGCVRR